MEVPRALPVGLHLYSSYLFELQIQGASDMPVKESIPEFLLESEGGSHPRTMANTHLFDLRLL